MFFCLQRPVGCDQGVPGGGAAVQRAVHAQREHQVIVTFDLTDHHGVLVASFLTHGRCCPRLQMAPENRDGLLHRRLLPGGDSCVKEKKKGCKTTCLNVLLKEKLRKVLKFT